MPVVRNSDSYLHEPNGEIWVGVRTEGSEQPSRVDAIRKQLAQEGSREVESSDHHRDQLLRVHDRELLDYLETASDQWQGSSLVIDPGQDRVVPYLFPHPGLIGSLPLVTPTAIAARAGLHTYDTMTLIGPGTWPAARGAADAALTAVDLVTSGENCAYALCRPPGHHATRSAIGGSCYLNNTAIAAAELGASTGLPVAVIDIDAHHGNGTQAIFYEDPQVLTASVHVDPGAGWFPHFLGFDSETGAGAGKGSNFNLPLAPGSGDEAWLGAIASAIEWVDSKGAGSLVLALGVDAAAGDPESPLEISSGGYSKAGEMLGALRLPSVIVQEGGYDLDLIGELVARTLTGFETGRP
ncbi:MAG: histone deacetylase family protein [Solirubrobacterales bacterium]